jgi:hypothetical protein
MASENEWIEWTGGAMPVPFGTKVDVRHRDGDEIVDEAGVLGGYAEDWSIDVENPEDGDIVDYRVVSA